MVFNLLLSHKTDSVQHCIYGKIIDKLEPYQLQPLRFIYKCFRKNQKGAILNEDPGMNFEIQISAFLQSISTDLKFKSPILIICTDKSLLSWNYHVTKYSGLETFILSEHNAKTLCAKYEKCVILVTQTQAKIVQKYKKTDFYLVIVEECENLANTKLFNELRGSFNIALTYKNIFVNRDQKILWKLLKWVNPESVGKFLDFCETDNFHLGNLSDPYSDLLFRQTWRFCQGFKEPTSKEIENLNDEIKKWSKANNIIIEDNTKTRKRKSATKQSEVSKKGKTEEEDITKTKEEVLKCSDDDLGGDVSALEDKYVSSHSVSKEVSYLFSRTVKDKFILALSKEKEKKVIVSKDSLFDKPVAKRAGFSKRNNSKTVGRRVSDTFLLTSFHDNKNPVKNRKSFPSNNSEFNLGNNLPIFDKAFLEEFNKSFQVDEVARKEIIRKTNNEILNNVSNFFDKSLTGSEKEEIVGNMEENNHETVKVSDKIADIQTETRPIHLCQGENIDLEIQEILEEIIIKVSEESDKKKIIDKADFESDENLILLNIIRSKPKIDGSFINEDDDDDNTFFKNLISKNVSNSSNHNIEPSASNLNDSSNFDVSSSFCDQSDGDALKRKRFNDFDSDSDSNDLLLHSDKDDFFKKFFCSGRKKRSNNSGEGVLSSLFGESEI